MNEIAVIEVVGLIFAGFVLGWLCSISSGIVIGYMIYRTKYAKMDIPFFRRSSPSKKGRKPVSYIDNLLQGETQEAQENLLEPELSKAAQRLHEQKLQATMSRIKGKK